MAEKELKIEPIIKMEEIDKWQRDMYDKRYQKEQEDNQMSYLSSLRRKEYLIMMSDSYNLNGEHTFPEYQKIFPFPSQRMLIGITGNTTIGPLYDRREIREYLLPLMEDRTIPLSVRMQELCRIAQIGKQEGQETQIHLAYTVRKKINYELYGITWDGYTKKEGYPLDCFVSTGIAFPDPDPFKLYGPTREMDVQNLRRVLLAVTEYEASTHVRPRIGGAIQGYVLGTDGEIMQC